VQSINEESSESRKSTLRPTGSETRGDRRRRVMIAVLGGGHGEWSATARNSLSEVLGRRGLGQVEVVQPHLMMLVLIPVENDHFTRVPRFPLRL